jgi:hypothetical protein
MPLSLPEKTILANILTNPSHNFVLYDFFFGDGKVVQIHTLKEMFIHCFVLLYKQKDCLVREKIAAFYAKKITLFLESNFKEKCPNLEKYFEESILSNKLNKNILHEIFIASKLAKASANMIIKFWYVPLLLEGFDRSLPSHSQTEKNAKKILQKTIDETLLWVENYPHELFDPVRFRQLKIDRLAARYHASMFLVVFYAIATKYDLDYGLIIALAISILIALRPSIMVMGWHAINAHNTTIGTLNLNLIESNEYDDAIVIVDRAKPSEPVYKYIMSVTTQAPSKPLWSTDIDSLPMPGIQKIKKSSEGKESEPVIKTVSDAKEKPAEIHPEFFGEEFKKLKAEHVVKINYNTKKKKTTYFGLWHESNLAKQIKTNRDTTFLARLFKVFTSGDMASKQGMNGIKVLPQLGLFEVKDKSIKGRVYGDEVRKVEGNTALIFEHYTPKGFH